MSETVQASPSAASPRSFRWSSVILWAVVFGIIGLLGWGLMNSNATRPEQGAPAPDFDMQFFDGYGWDGRSTAKLSDMQGKIVVLNFWASWCVECRVEAEDLQASWEKYHGQDVVFLGIAHVDVEPKSIAYLQEFNVTYPNAPDLGTVISNDYKITGVPETFIIGKDGKIAHVQIGPITGATLNGTIEQLLAEGG
ncbi:MAG: TlpA family protein disulfide reductase [Anaerolineae bacterium]